MNGNSALVILIAAIFTTNILLTNFLGMCSFVACSGQIGTSLGLGTAVTFVMTMTTMINYAIYHHLLVPLGLEHLTFIVFIAVIAGFVQFVEMFVERFSLKLYFALGIFLPLITVNCAILSASLFMVIREYTFVQTVGFGFGAGVGWAVAIVLMAGLRQKMRYSNVPKPFEGVAVAMIITGVLAMAFMGFAGMVSIQQERFMVYLWFVVCFASLTIALAALLMVAARVLVNYGVCKLDINAGEKPLEVEGGQTLLSTLYGNEIFIPSACGGKGSCGHCKITVTAGGGPVLSTETPYLTRKEIREDVFVRIPEDLLNVWIFESTVESVIDLTHEIKGIRMQLDDPAEIAHRPGQYVQVQAPSPEGPVLPVRHSCAVPR